MCKEMPVIPVNRVVDPKRIIGKMEDQRGGEAQGAADPPPQKEGCFWSSVTRWGVISSYRQYLILLGVVYSV
jgi:hypothetical protein